MAITYYTMLLMNDGTVKCVGENEYGQLGLGDKTNRTTVTTIPNLTNVRRIVSSHNRSFFILNDGTVKACGKNISGELGLGHTSEVLVPTLIPNLNNIRTISCGTNHTMFLTNNGFVKCIGDNYYGQLGLGNNINQTSIQLIPKLYGVREVVCSSHATYFLMADINASVKGCGINNNGQLGLSHTTSPISTITNIPITNVTNISCGVNYVIFLLSDGTVHFAGNTEQGQSGLGHSGPYAPKISTITQIPNVSNVKDVSCGEIHTIFLLNDDTLRMVGSNRGGEVLIGYASSEEPYAIASVSATNMPNVESIFCGAYYTIIKFKDGTLKGAGINGNGQLCLGNNTSPIVSLTNIPITNVSSIGDSKYNNMDIPTWIYQKSGSISLQETNITLPINLLVP